jgi:hypothetical protein
MSRSRVVEKYYSLQDLTCLVGFSEKFWRERCQAGDLTLRDGEQLLAEPLMISGELRVPASAVNAFLSRHPYNYDAGVKARNTAELRRKLKGKTPL